MELVFFISIIILVYIYVGYPLFVFAVSRFFHRPVTKQYGTPKVSLLISAYNEEKVIKDKIKNALALDYPKEFLEIIVISDASTDNTENLVKKYADQEVKLLRVEGRRGKTYCQNEAVAQATGDIMVFSDANSMYHPRAIAELAANFSDAKVGVVCGELRYVKTSETSEGLYWNIETFLKYCESRIDSCLGANGAIYAIRKSEFIPLPQHAQGDFIEPFFVYKKGLRVVYDATAYCTEKPGLRNNEFARKVRIVIGALESLAMIREFLNPFRYGWYSFTLWSHKVIRWFTFVFMFLLLISNIYLSVFSTNPYFTLFLGAQTVFYFSAFIGRKIRIHLFSIPYYFTLLQIASFVGTWKMLRGQTATTWESNRL